MARDSATTTKPAEPLPIEREIRACRACAERFAGTHSAHEPRPVVHASATARVCVAGQAPGVRVHESGLPFNDPSGDRLRDWMGIDRDTFYDRSRLAILPMAFCFPGHDAKGGDLPPPKLCAKLWREKLFEAHPQIELLLVVGSYAQDWHLGAKRPGGLSGTVARWRKVLESSSGPRLFPLPHPSWRNNAWLRKNPWFEAETLPALRAELAPLLESPTA